MTAQDMAKTLNDALAVDPACISTMFNIRRTCNQQLTDHPHIQVLGETGKPGVIRFIGLLNGMLLDSGSTDVLVMTIDDAAQGNVIGFSVVPATSVGVEATVQGA